MSQIERAIARHRREMHKVETDAFVRMSDGYIAMIDSVESDLLSVLQRIELARANGDEVNIDWLRREARYRRLLIDLEAQWDVWEREGTRIVRHAKATAVERGGQDGDELLGIMSPDTNFAGRINWEAMESLAGQLAPDSPLAGVIASHGARANEVISRELMAGLRGKGADAIYRAIRRELTGDVAETRLRALVRTEMMRSYRHALDDQFRHPDARVQGKMWTAARSPVTCLACLARDGQVFPLDYEMDAHVNCRCSWSPLPENMYPSVARYLANRGSGEDYVRSLAPATQRRMIGSQEAWEAFRDGKLRLSDFLGVQHSDVWGHSIYQLSGRRALINAGLPYTGRRRPSGGGMPAPAAPIAPPAIDPARGYSPAAGEMLRQYEAQHWKDGFETATVVHPLTGELILHKRGQETSVSFENYEAYLMKDMILTHNHPTGWRHPVTDPRHAGNSFSSSDLYMFASADLQEIRATTPTHLYRLRRPANPGPAFERVYKRSIQGKEYDALRRSLSKTSVFRIENDVRNEMWARIHRGEITVVEAEAGHWDEVARRIADAWGLDYSKEEYTP